MTDLVARNPWAVRSLSDVSTGLAGSAAPSAGLHGDGGTVSEDVNEVTHA
jgi:hypothetical protein